MFEVAELGRRMDKAEYNAMVPDLRTKLLAMQRELLEADFPVIILLNGVDGAGKGATANLLAEWLDARGVETNAFGEPTEEEAQRPDYWRYWMALPPKGKIGVFIGNWYTRPILDRVFDRTDDLAFTEGISAARRFEKTLADDGALILKFWFHLSPEEQEKRLQKLESSKATRWRVSKKDWKHFKRYEQFRIISERALRDTSTGEAPWNIVEGTDSRYRNATVTKQLLHRVSSHMELRKHAAPPKGRPEGQIDDPFTILDQLDLTLSVDRKTYGRRLEELQGRLNRLGRKLAKQDKRCILVFEGSDASGKGGAIRRTIAALDARQYRVIPVAAPTDEERSQHYLWRFWRHLPRLGRFTIYDRSWYGRVLVERVEGFAHESEWRRAYSEINEFEHQLTADGRTVLCKFWLHISREEQLRRFQERERVPYKQHKITEEDYRNREKSNLYEAAAEEMVGRTSTTRAPWTLVEAENKFHARLKVLDTVCQQLESAL